MLPRVSFLRTLALTLHLPPLLRASSTMSPSQPYALDRHIFNPDLYARMRQIWFADLPPNATVAAPQTMQRWFGVGMTPEDKLAFDETCRQAFLPALQALGPNNLLLPETTSYAEEVAKAAEIAGPLLREVEDAGSEPQRAQVLLSLSLLLDQMPRNLFRTRSDLPLVYRHYDRLARALVGGAMEMQPSPVDYEEYKKRVVFGAWYLMPLLHSEDLAAHEVWDVRTAEMERLAREAGDERALAYLGKAREAEEKHLEPLRRFGRYPHRNQCLGRESTQEEKEWLKGGDTFGVEQDSGDDGSQRKDEL